MKRIPPPVCLWACKERYNLYMNRASLDLEWLVVYRELAQPLLELHLTNYYSLIDERCSSIIFASLSYFS